jgi:DNA-binding transcriptional LysR family regulator
VELKWLDDYVALVETGSFSAAAARRHVSQPAFSRRIRMLEDWLGVTLVDRSRRPLQFSPAAHENQANFRGLVARIYEFRALLKAAAQDVAGITIAAQHTLATAHVPALLTRLQALSPGQSFRLRSDDRSDCIARLVRGEVDILIVYETDPTRCAIPAPMARREVLGSDELVLAAAPSLRATLARMRPGEAVPMLCFPPESFFGQVVRAQAMPELMRSQQVVVRCVSEFAMGLRELALIGQGAAWLPASLIADDLRRGRLQPLRGMGRSVPMDIVFYFATAGGDPAGAERRIELVREAARTVPSARRRPSRRPGRSRLTGP